MTAPFPHPPAPPLRRLGRLAAAAGIVAATAGLAVGTVRFARDQARQRYVFSLTEQTNTTQTRAQELLGRHVDALEVLAGVVSRWPEINREEYDARAAQTMKDAPAFTSMNVVDEEGLVAFAHADDGRRTDEGLHVPARPDARSALGGADDAPTTVGEPRELPEAGWTARFTAPVRREQRPAGAVEGLFLFRRFIEQMLHYVIGGDTRILLIDEETGVVLGGTDDSRPGDRSPALDGAFRLRAAGRGWWVVLHPRHAPPVLLLTAALVTVELSLGVGLLILTFRRFSHA